MNNMIKVFPEGSASRERLKTAASLLSAFSPDKRTYYVSETYFDFGQDWKWTTILCNGSKWGDYQALNPRNQEDILLAESPTELAKVIEDIFNDKFCPDKKT